MPSDALHRHIAARIRELAGRKEMSLNKLADFAGISRSQLRRVIRCEQAPTTLTLAKIAKALEVSTRELFPAEG